ncbi:CBM35 domain-containing protein [Hymenobacter sp. H14-R3]|uniref:CBM35 domain-containing protein n=1 Tax=Hymenobacter sp. H14-R3 TaxID=3046308 RepID=UPI0024B8AAC9|nr:CBM35 domain-containing protein [Hymenobacter sp. H14-R3]MDJ0365328.1 CBM35 domain-containing protein [Hymenobacter sp. H14-R3]
MLHSYQSVSSRFPLAKALGLLGFGAALLAAPAVHAQVIATTPKIEAEAPTNTLTGGAVVKNVNPATAGNDSYSGTGWVDYNAAPSGIDFPYTAGAAGLYEVLVRYASQYEAKPGNIHVNGGPAGKLYYNSTRTGTNFRSTKTVVALTAGANKITLEGGDNYYGIDYIQVAAVAAIPTALTPAATTGRVEAEAGQLYFAQAVIKDGNAATSYSGTGGYVSSFSEDKALVSTITLPVNIVTAGLYQIAVGARGIFDDKSFDLSVARGAAAATGKLTTGLGRLSTTFQSFVSGKYNLVAGVNTIVISSQTSYLDVDYVDITPATGVATAARASAEAQKALSAYPNPTSGQALSVSLELAKAQETTFDLVNSLGQRVSTTTRSLRAGTNQLQVPTAGVAGGIYQLVVRGGDQPALVQRVVIN